MKGIILAGGNGTRLYPVTKTTSKHLLQVYDKPMIYYPLSVMLLANISDILIISTPHHLPQYQALLGDGSQWGISLSYATQESPDGIASALIIGEKFIGHSPVCLMLGDNIFHGQGLINLLSESKSTLDGATIFCSYVKDPTRYGVAVFDENERLANIVEKPPTPLSHFAITGLYFYDNNAPALAKELQPSARGEKEISDLNAIYLKQNRIQATLLSRGFAWFDVGTHQSLLDASQYVAALEQRQSLKIACIEEIAWRRGFITSEQLSALAKPLAHVDYGQYLLQVLNEKQTNHNQYQALSTCTNLETF